jgi:hypothetical protein
VVHDDHERTLFEFQIDPACGIGQDKSANAHPAKHARGKGDFRRRIPFIQMHAPLHDRDCDVAGLSDHHLTRVANGGGSWKRRNAGVRNASRLRQLAGKSTEAGTQHDSDTRTKRRLRKQKLSSRFGTDKVSLVRHNSFL